MNSKIAVYMFFGALGYIVFAGSVMLFYQDDPARMDLIARQEFNLKYFDTLSLDKQTARHSMIDYLGPPDITEAKRVKGVIYQVLFYRTRNIKSDGITSKDECTPLLFLNGLLIAWGNDAYTQYQSY